MLQLQVEFGLILLNQLLSSAYAPPNAKTKTSPPAASKADGMSETITATNAETNPTKEEHDPRLPGTNCGVDCPLGGKSGKYPKVPTEIYHVTTKENACKILGITKVDGKEPGFIPGKGGMVGGGVYFALTPETARDKATGAVGGPKRTLEALVNVGCMLEIKNIGERHDWRKSGDGPDVKGFDWTLSTEENRKKLQEIRCDSVGLSWSAVPGEEVCIYDAKRQIEGTVMLKNSGCICQ